MNQSIILNLVKIASIFTLFLFFLDSNEFQGNYLVAALEFIMMTLIISLIFNIIYGGILLVQRFVNIKA
ncbi:MAG: hypothetical protein AB8G86_30245 [Saprospiraceae bacterium]